MATYVIGDIHGCYDELQKLLTKINFDEANDTLRFTGDLINGGPKPCEVLRLIKSLGDKHICVLGNHDLVLLACNTAIVTPKNDRKIGFEPVLQAPDRDELLDWLRMRKVIHFEPKYNLLLVHAGVLPIWSLSEIQQYASDVETLLHGDNYLELYANMFGDLPNMWSNSLVGFDRIRFIINCFMRMRFCTPSGQLDLTSKGTALDAPSGFLPWFKIPRKDNLNIIFGHWAALDGITNMPHAIAMDTGCVWDRSLTALCLDDNTRISVAHSQ